MSTPQERRNEVDLFAIDCALKQKCGHCSHARQSHGGEAWEGECPCFCPGFLYPKTPVECQETAGGIEEETL